MPAAGRWIRALGGERVELTRVHVEQALRMRVEERSDGLVRRRLAHRAAERDELVALLDDCGGNVSEVSRRLGVTRGAVAYRLKKYGLA